MYYIIIEILIFVSIIAVYLNNKKQKDILKKSEYTLFYEETARIAGVELKNEPFEINAERIIMKLQEKMSEKGHKNLYFISTSRKEESNPDLPDNISYYTHNSEKQVSDDEELFKDNDHTIFENNP